MCAQCRWLIGLSAAACLAAALAGSRVLAANSPPAFDLRDDVADTPPTPRLGIERTAPSLPPAQLSGSSNPLWAIPLASLRATRERPIFLSSRRPLAPLAVADTSRAEPFMAAVEPEPPPLDLVGVVSGIAGGFAVFINVATRDIVRLRAGESHDGWVLRAVKGREAVLEKNEHSAVIGLPVPVGDSK
jgi:general secretion pathway protein N